MFRDLGRVHIVSFAVGIVGLIVGIVGIVLAIVFGTAQTTCTTPVTPTCPVITTQACNTNLFGISTTVNNMKWNDAYNNPNGAEYINAVNNITSTLTNSLNAGLNNQSSSSSFLRILAATGPTSNNVKVEITRLDKDGNGLVIAIGNGAISAAVPIENMPNATNVANVITADKNTYSNSTATPQVCPTCSECQPCTTPAYECPTCTPSPADCPTPTPTIGTTQTKPPTTTTTKPAPSTPALTSTRKTTTQETPITSTQFKFNSTTGPQTTTQKAPSSSLSPVPVPSTTQPKPTSAGSTSSTPKPQTSSPVPSTTTPTTTTPTTTTPTTTTPTTTTPTTTSPTTTSPTTTSPTTTSPSTTTPTTTPTTTTPSTTTPTTTSPTTTIVTTPTTSTATTTTPTPTTTTTTPAQSTSTVPLSTTQGTTTVPPTIGPSQCYYQSNIAIAVELTSDDSPIDLKMQGFIYNNLLFYPGNPYQLGKRGSNMTELALVPYPTYTEIGSIMGYGAATTPQRISGLFNSSFPVFAGPDPEIYEALNFISNLTYDGNPGYVIIMGKNGSSVVKSLPSSELLQTLGFTVITIGYQSSDDFSLLASNPGLSFIINQDSDELVVARQIGNILNTSYCVPSSPSPGYITSSTLPVITSKSTPAPSTVTTTLPPSSSSPVPAPSSSPQPVPSSSIGTSSTSPGTTSSQQGVSSTSATLPTTQRSTTNNISSSQKPSSTSPSSPTPKVYSYSTSGFSSTQTLPSSSSSSVFPTSTSSPSSKVYSSSTIGFTSTQPSSASQSSSPVTTSTAASSSMSSSSSVNPSQSTLSSSIATSSQSIPTSSGSQSSTPSTSGPSTSTAPISTGASSSTPSVPTPSGTQSTSPQFSTQTTPPTQPTSTAQFTSTSAQLTSSSVPAGTTGTTLPTTAPPTKAPGECYYQSNVAVAFELATSAEDIDLQIQNFITNDLFFYPGAPYDLGNITAGKTELSLVPYPNDDTLGNVMAYGFAWNPGQIGTAMEFFQQTAQQTPIISDAFKYIPLNKRTGAPGFVILVGNSDASAPAAVASAKNLQALGFKIITVAYKSAGSFIALSSDPSYNFQIHQDADKKSVAKAIGDILYAYACTTTVAPSSTVTVPQVSTSSPMAPKGSTSSSAPSTTVTNPTVPSTSIFQSSSTVSYTTTSGPTPTTCVCTTIEPGSTSPGYSTSTYATTMGSSSFSTASTPSMTSGSTPGASSSLSTQPSTPGGSTASSQSPGPSSSSPSPQTSTMGASTSSPSQQSSSAVTYTTATAPSGSTSSAASTSSPVASSTVTVPSTVPTSSGSTTSQICPNQQTVFDGSVGVIFELLPASAQQATINAFVENILLNSKYYGLAVDNLTNQNRTLATAIPYPSTDKYGVTGYGSARSLNDFKNEVIAFNGAIQPVTQTSHLSDALLYVANTLQSVTPKASLIIVGNSDSMIDNLAQFWADQLKANFTIYTVAVGDGATANLAPLSSGDGYSFTGNTQQIADQIGLKMATSNPAIYCPPPVPSTSAPITSTVSMSSTAPVSTTITSTTRLTTAKPTVGPCQCAGRWVYNGDMAIAFEFINGTDGSKQVTNFISNTLLKNPSSYGLSADVNGNQPSKLTIIPYPETNSYFLNPYGSIKQASDIGEFVDIYSGVRSTDTTPSIDDAFVYIKTLNTLNANAKVVLLVASDGSKVADAMDSANALKANGYTVITVAQTASADVFKPLASGDKYTLQIGTGNDDAVADQIANLLLDLSFVCYDDGSSTPAPTTRCPGTQGTTQPGSTGTTPVASSSSSMGSTVPSGTSSTMGSTVSSGSSSSMGSTVPSVSTSTMAGSSSSSAGSTVSVGSTVPTQSTSQGSSSSMGSTVSQGSTSTQPPASSSSSAGTITSTMGSTVTSASSTQGSSTLGSTVTSTMRPSVGPCDCQGRWVYNGDMAIAFEFIKDSSDSDKVTNFVSNTLLKDPSSYGLSADVNGNQPSQLTIVPYPNPDDYAAADSLPYGYFKNSTMIGNTINQYRVFQSDSTDPSIADALTYIGELTTGPNAKVVLLVAAEGTDVTPAMDSANALKANGYTVITVAQTASADVFKPLASGDKYSLQIGIGNDDAVAATIASLLLDISSVCYDDGSNTASPTTRCPGSQGTTLPGSTGTTSVAGSSSSMGSTVSSGSTSTMGSTVSSGSSSSPGSTVSSGSSSSMGSTASGSSSGSTASVGSTATTQSTSQGSSSSMGSTVSSGSTSTMAGSPSTSVGSTASVGSTVPTQSTSPGSSSSVGSTVSQGSTSTQPPASSASTITSTMGSTATSAPSTQGSSTSGSTAANTGSTSSPAQTSTMGSTVTSGPSTSPVPLCASPFNGKIAVVVEMNKTDTSIQLAEAFVKNNLYNSPNYNFADVTQAINLPYGSTDQYETNILKFGAAKSLADLQKNVDDLHNNAVASLPAVADGLGWIENNIDAPAAGSKTIVIVVGYSDDNNPGSTFFTKTDLQNAGYQFMSVSVGPGNLKDVADKPEWYFQVDQSNGQTIANQISYILCNL
ncbi:unnamed protein product [Caenorhabditis nigoni]|uniref:VWFA domain-containing protein n=1 Tax=Caenorhabditis nigoni TaxID=1611254 RepID=A0A2G5UZL4_9PELO|nr:hypothetical protein B9Z55_005157 [Caenorhabditis nigoni]